MKIIVVNIYKSIAIHELEPKEATRRAWVLNLEKAKRYKYVIGNNKGQKYYFNLLDAKTDKIDNDRVEFILEECLVHERTNIENYTVDDVLIKDKRFEYVTTKYID